MFHRTLTEFYDVRLLKDKFVRIIRLQKIGIARNSFVQNIRIIGLCLLFKEEAGYAETITKANDIILNNIKYKIYIFS